MQIWMIMNWIFNMATTATPWCLTTSAGWTTSIEFEKWLAPAAAPPRLMSPIFLLAIRRYQSYFSHIRKKAKNRGTTTHTWYNLDYCHARPNTSTTVEPRKNNNKLSFVGVRCSSCKQIQKKPRRSWRGERNKGLEDLKIGHFFLIPYFHSHIIC